jgi:Transposase DDE domain.
LATSATSAEKKGAFLLGCLLSKGQSGVRVRHLGGNRAGELRITRFLRSRHVTPGEMFATARARTLGLVKDRHVLVIQDTTSLRDDGQAKSLQLHPAIAVDAAEGALLGLLSAQFLRRDQLVKTHCNKRALAEKESRRWIEATQEAQALREAGAARVTVIADREGDIYEEFALRPPDVDVLIRVHHDRKLAEGTSLYAATTDTAELGRETIALPAAPGRPARSATLALRATPVRIERPKRNRASWAAALPPAVELWLVDAREVDPPSDATPIHWRLLTTHAVTTLAEGCRITGFYRRRWVIEQVFRVMKTKGFDIEAVRIEAVRPFENLAAATLIAAIQVQQMVHDRDGTAARPLSDVFEADEQPALEAVCATLEGKTARQKNPHPKGSLAYGTWVCARLGGWTGYYGKPGPIVILQGHLRFKEMLAGWKIARDV